MRDRVDESRHAGFRAEFRSELAALPVAVRAQVKAKIDEVGARLGSYPHFALTGSPSFRLRVGDYRVIYEFDVRKNEIYLLALGNRAKIYR